MGPSFSAGAISICVGIDMSNFFGTEGRPPTQIGGINASIPYGIESWARFQEDINRNVGDLGDFI
jgi:hypothetical protein